MRLPVADRLDRFVRERLRPLRVEASAPVDIAAWPVPGEPVPFSEARGREFRPLRVGAPWGTPWSTLWLHVTGVVPRDWDASEHHRSELLVDLGFNDQSPGFQA